MSTIRGCPLFGSCPLFGDFGRKIQYRGVDELTKCCLSSTVFFIQIWGFLYWEVSHHTNNRSPSQYQEHLIFFPPCRITAPSSTIPAKASWLAWLRPTLPGVSRKRVSEWASPGAILDEGKLLCSPAQQLKVRRKDSRSKCAKICHPSS